MERPSGFKIKTCGLLLQRATNLAGGVSLELYLLKGHVAQVAGEKLSCQGLAQTRQDLDDFHGPEAAHRAGHGAKNGELAFPKRRRLGIKASQARSSARQDRC